MGDERAGREAETNEMVAPIDDKSGRRDIMYIILFIAVGGKDVSSIYAACRSLRVNHL